MSELKEKRLKRKQRPGEEVVGADAIKRRKRGERSTSDEDNSRSASGVANEDESVRTVYCEGLSYDCTEEEVKRYFTENCGAVISLRMPRYQDSGKPRGYCHVEFALSASVPKAVALSGSKLRGRYLKIEGAKAKNVKVTTTAAAPRSRPEKCRTIYVRNLPYDVSADIVRNAFLSCGAISDVRIVVWNHTKRQKGFGYVQFIKESSAEAAVRNQAKINVKGRPVFVDYDAPDSTGPKKSFRTPEGLPWAKTKAGRKDKKDRKVAK